MSLGLPYDQFWRLTPRAVENVMRGAIAARDHRIREIHLAATLNAFAYHDPKNMPQVEGLIGGRVAKRQSAAAIRSNLGILVAAGLAQKSERE